MTVKRSCEALSGSERGFRRRERRQRRPEIDEAPENSRQSFDPTVGRYSQRDLEAMDRETLQRLHEWAYARLGDHMDEHVNAVSCRTCDYFELLCGAAFDLAMAKGVR